MRKPETIECLYLDFDGFFASVMQQIMPALRGKPVGVIPMDMKAAQSTVVIACSREAKAQGCKNIMRVREALEVCPDLILVTQRPDFYRRAHNALINEIACEVPIEAIKSIDELTCRLDPANIKNPHDLAQRIKTRLRENIGPYITCSIGFAANRMLAKIACKMDKPDGVTVWHPHLMPAPLLPLPFDDVPGIGSRMQDRLHGAGIACMGDLLATEPKQLRALWGNVNGERMWYALHGYDIKAMPTGRGMYGHSRVLPPEWRDFGHARDSARLLLTKAARRMRRDGWYSNRLYLSLDLYRSRWRGERELPCVKDDQACLQALSTLWEQARAECGRSDRIVRVGVVLLDLVSGNARQLDMFVADDFARRKWEALTGAVDLLNGRYGKRVVSVGPWKPPPGKFAGGKIAFSRIPSAEDFW